MESDIPQKLVATNAPINTFFNDMDRGTEGPFRKFADDIQLNCAGDMMEGRDGIQRDRDRLEGWGHMKNMKYRLGGEWIE